MHVLSSTFRFEIDRIRYYVVAITSWPLDMYYYLVIILTLIFHCIDQGSVKRVQYLKNKFHLYYTSDTVAIDIS